MLSTRINSHIDEVEKIEEKAKADIDKIIKAIDIKDLIRDPHGVMMDTISEIKKVMEDKHIAQATALGVDFAKMIESMKKPIVIDPSKNPTENA